MYALMQKRKPLITGPGGMGYISGAFASPIPKEGNQVQEVMDLFDNYNQIENNIVD